VMATAVSHPIDRSRSFHVLLVTLNPLHIRCFHVFHPSIWLFTLASG
jgi:hypothetical protein